jgi:CRP-like cAMP-binding protein
MIFRRRWFVSAPPGKLKVAAYIPQHLGPESQVNRPNGLKAECVDCPVRSNALFRDFSGEQASRFLCIFRRINSQTNPVLFSEGSSPDRLFALRSGLVKIVKSLENGKERILRIVFPGAIFGLEALSGIPHSASAVAFHDAEICAVTREEFFAFLQENPDISLAAVRFLAGEVAQLSTQISAMSFKDARKKVATLLRSLVPPEQAQMKGSISLTLPFSTQEVGEILELASETVSRTWSALGSDGIVEKHGRKVIIQDLETLENVAHRE